MADEHAHDNATVSNDRAGALDKRIRDHDVTAYKEYRFASVLAVVNGSSEVVLQHARQFR